MKYSSVRTILFSILFFTSMVSLVITSKASAGAAFSPPTVSEDVEALIDEKGFAVGPLEAAGSSGVGRGVFANGDIPGKSPRSFNLFATSCNSYWWVRGSHSWKWKDYIFTGDNQLYGKTWTTFGSATNPCGPALIVDVITVKGYGKGAGFNPVINKTLYNTNFVDDTKKVKWIAKGTGGHICGAQVTHTATKNGVTWSSASASGC